MAQWDLALSSGTGSYEAKYWAGTETFQNPLVSFVYERGWRQGFSWAGFPGVEVLMSDTGAFPERLLVRNPSDRPPSAHRHRRKLSRSADGSAHGHRLHGARLG